MSSSPSLLARIEWFKCSIVFGSFLAYFIVDGVSLSIGIFAREFIDYFQRSDSQTLVFLIPALIQAIPLLVSPLVCRLIELIGCRAVAFVGATLISSSFLIISYLVYDLISLNVVMGLVTSVGFAMLYIPSYLIISFYFEERRALATGVAVSGSGLGLFAISPLIESLIGRYGWRDTCFLFAAISSHLFISACLYRPKPEDQPSKNEKPTPAPAVTDVAPGILVELKRIYSSRRFVLVSVAYFLLSLVIVAPYNFLPVHIELNQLDDPSSLCISLIGLSSLIGQIVIGLVSDKWRSLNWFIFAACICVAGVATCTLPFLASIRAVYIYSIVFGFATSVNYVLQSSLVIESLGLANLIFAFGYLQFTQGISTLLGPIILGLIKDHSDNYNVGFYLSGLVMVGAGVVLGMWPLQTTPAQQSDAKTQTQTVSDDIEMQMPGRENTTSTANTINL